MEESRYFLRSWGILAAVITSFVALLAITVGALYQSFSHVTEETKFRTKTEDRLTEIEKSLLAIQAKMVLSKPPDSENQADAKGVLAYAKKESIQLPESVIAQGGQKFIEAAARDPKAWDVALDFVNYRSSMNTTFRMNGPMVPLPSKKSCLLLRLPRGAGEANSKLTVQR